MISECAYKWFEYSEEGLRVEWKGKSVDIAIIGIVRLIALVLYFSIKQYFKFFTLLIINYIS